MESFSKLQIGLGLTLLILLSVTACGKNDDTNGRLRFNNGIKTVKGSSIDDYYNKVSEFDDMLKNGDLSGAPIGQGDEAPFNGDTPAAASSRAAGREFKQSYVNLVDLLNQNSAVGILKMTITRDNTEGQETIINTLVMDESFGQDSLIATVDLTDLDATYTYTSQSPDSYCWMAHIDTQTKDVLKLNDLGIPSQGGETDTSTDAYCPIKLNSYNKSTGKAEIELQVEDLPGFEGSRKTIKSLGRYGDFTQGASNILGYEIKLEGKNSAGQYKDYITTMYFTIVAVDLTPPNGARAYRYLGSLNGHEYYFISTPVPFSEVKTQAALIMAAQVGFKGYGVAINSAEEQSFLESVAPKTKAWMGLDDIEQEGNPKWHSGEAHTYTAKESFNNDGNEDCMEFNFDLNGMKNDTECYHNRAVLIEIEPTQNGGIIE